MIITDTNENDSNDDNIKNVKSIRVTTPQEQKNSEFFWTMHRTGTPDVKLWQQSQIDVAQAGTSFDSFQSYFTT